jgi:hypothetical protein
VREFRQRLAQGDRREIRPQHIGEPHFGIGRLPQQEIRQPDFARGADQQIERRQAGGIELGLDRLGVIGALRGGLGSGAGDLVLRAVVERDRPAWCRVRAVRASASSISSTTSGENAV